jgi:hypothetical protein
MENLTSTTATDCESDHFWLKCCLHVYSCEKQMSFDFVVIKLPVLGHADDRKSTKRIRFHCVHRLLNIWTVWIASRDYLSN